MEPTATSSQESPTEKLSNRYPEAAALFGAQAMLDTPRDYGTLIPAPDLFSFLTHQRLEDAGLPKMQEEAVSEMAHALIQEDQLTGFDKPHYKELNLLLAQSQKAFAAEQGESLPVFYLGCDVSNLRGLNLAMSGQDITTIGDQAISAEGREGTNHFLKLFSGIVEKEVKEQVAAQEAAGGNAQASFYRDGGDELSTIIVGLPEASVRDVQARINHKVEVAVTAAGLNDLMHPKHPYIGNRAGVGLACGVVEVQVDSELEALGLAVDGQIDALRSVSKTEKHAPAALRTQLNEAEIQKALGAVKQQAAELGVTLAPSGAANHFPFANQPVKGAAEGEFIWPQLRRQMQTNSLIEAQNMHGEGEYLLRGLLGIYESRDPVTGCERHSPMAAISDGLDYLKSNPNEPAHALIFEMQNFAGLNEAKGHSGCDQIFGQLASRIQLPSDNLLLYRPDGTGDRIYGFVRGVSSEDVALSVRKLNAATDMVAAVNGVSDVPNPRYPEKGYEGVQFVTAAVDLQGESLASPAEVFQKLDARIRDSKENLVRFDGRAIGVNEVAPFTKAERAQTSGAGQHVYEHEVRLPMPAVRRDGGNQDKGQGRS